MNNKSFQKAKKMIFALALALGLLLPANSTLALPQKTAPAADASSGRPTDRIIIKYEASFVGDPAGTTQMDVLRAAAAAPLTAAGATLSYARAMSGNAHVLLLSKRLPLADVQTISATLTALSEVKYAEPDRILQHALNPFLGTPDDTQYVSQWNYNDTYGINAPAAWAITTGDAATTVAVIDTGITSHEDLDEVRVLPGYDFISDPLVANDSTGRDAFSEDSGDWVTSGESTLVGGPFEGCSVSDSSWHGTHVAGTIGASSNNNKGVTGINWHTSILPVRVLGKCGGYTSDVVDGMRWAAGLAVAGVDLNTTPAKVLNLSLGGPGACSQTEQSAINDVTAVSLDPDTGFGLPGFPGAVVVAAAGNGIATSDFSPANCTGVITVAATDQNGELASFSNYGSTVEISAPGDNIISTSNAGPTVLGFGNYTAMNGTSMAAAHVSGVVSLMFSANSRIIPSQVLEILQTTAKSFSSVKEIGGLGSLCTLLTCGSGIVDAGQAVKIAHKPDLIVTNVALDTTPAANAPFDVNVTIKNQGGSNSGSLAYIDVFIDTNPSDFIVDPPEAPDYHVGCVNDSVSTPYFTTNDMSTLPPGTSLTKTISIGPPLGAVLNTGIYDVYAYADAECIIDEGFEANNNYPVIPINTGVSPGTFVKSTPVDGANTLSSPNVTLTWGTSSTALSYEYCVDATNNNICDGNAWVSVAGTSANLTGLHAFTNYYWQVRAVNIFGNTPANAGAWWLFTILPPPAPALVSPTNALVTKDNTPSFVWGSVVSGNTYQFELSTTSNFASVLQTFTGGVGVLTHDASVLPDGKYYWHVRAYNVSNDVGAWSATYSLTIDTLSPSTPILNTPADKLFVTSKTPTLSVFPVTGANRYRFQVSSDPLFGSTAVDVTATTVSYTLTAAQALQYGTYYWRASSIDQAGNVSDWSLVRQIGLTFQLAPLNDGYLVTATPTFKWTTVPGALGYRLQVSKADTFADLEIDRYQGKLVSYISPALDYGTHYWRVRVCTSGGCTASTEGTSTWGLWSPTVRITLTPPISAAPVLVSPVTKALLSGSSLTLTWKKVMEDDRYQIQIDNLSTFASPEQDFVDAYVKKDVFSYTTPIGPLTTLPDGIYYWRVRTSNYLSVPGAWSLVRGFTIDTIKPLAPALISPLNAVSVIGTPTFSWTASLTAVKYQFQYDDDPGFGTPYTSADLTTLNVKPPIIPLGTYSWRVLAKDAAGNVSLPGTARTITINPPTPAAPVLTAPAVGLATKNQTPLFTWSDVPYAVTYDIQISTTAAFTSSVGKSGLLTPTYTPASDLPAATYYWRVHAVNLVSIPGPWSAPVRAFTVDITAPLAPALSIPLDNASVIATPTFSWTKPLTSVKYQFQYDDDPLFGSPYIPAEQTTLIYKPPTMPPGTYYWRVSAKDAADNWSSWSTSRTVTILPAPVLTAPLVASLVNTPTPIFNWNTVSGTGVTYKLEISTTTTFTPATTQSVNGSGVVPPYTLASPLTSLTTNGLYYWHVRAENSALAVVGPWSLSRSFTFDNIPPLAPVLNLPLDNVSVIVTPAFSWTASLTATKYKFEYDVDSGFGSGGLPLHYTSGELAGVSFTPPAMVPDTYYWRVSARDAANNWSILPGVFRKITILPAPALLLPTIASSTNDQIPDFSWSPVTGTGVTYEIQISTTAAFTNVVGQSGLLTPTYTSSSNLPVGLNYWRVRAASTATVMPGPWSVIRSFTVDLTPPPAPVLGSPAVNASVIGNPLFSWTKPLSAVKYQFEYDVSSGFDSAVGVSHYIAANLMTISHTPNPAMIPGISYYWRVTAFDAAGNSSVSVPRMVTILATPPAPVLISPVAGFLTSSSTPTFNWGPVAGTGITYNLQISKTATFILPVAQALSSLGVPPHIVITPLTDGVYYWRVQAVNSVSVAGAWSAARSLIVKNTPPLAPVLNLPLDAASVVGTPTFSWKAALTAVKYQFEYDVSSGFDSAIGPLHYISPDLTVLSFKPPTMYLCVAPSCAYSWRVIAKDAAGNLSVWSTVRTVRVTPLAATGVSTLLGPINGSVSLNPMPTLSWKAVLGAVRYQVQIDGHSTFSSPTVDQKTDLVLPVLTNFTPATVLSDGTYYWHVRKVDVYGGVGPWSAIWRFSVTQPIPLAVTSFSQSALSAMPQPVDTGTPTFTWNSVEYGDTYQIQVAGDKDFTTPAFDDTADTTSRTVPAPLSNGDYFWRVRAINIYKTPGPWSETWTININVPPVAPALLLPTDAATLSTGVPTFSWQSVADATNYQIQVDDNAKFSNPEFDNTAASTSRTPATALTDGKYFWRVRALNVNDAPGAWSDSRSLTISVPPNAPLLVMPQNEATEITGTPTFNWESVSNGVTYQIQVDDSQDFSTPEFADTAATTTRKLVTPLTDGLYFWRVRAMNIYDVAGAWSEPQTVTIRISPLLLTPKVDATETTGMPVFSWEVVTDAIKYQVQVDDNQDFSSPEFDNTAATTNRVPDASLVNGVYYWRVRALAINDTPSQWSPAQMLTIALP